MWPQCGRSAAASVRGFPISSLSPRTSALSLSQSRAWLSTSSMNPLRRSRAAFEPSSPPSSSSSSPLPSSSPRSLLPAKRWRVKQAVETAVSAAVSFPSPLLDAIPPHEVEVSAESPLLSSHVSSFLSSVSSSADGGLRCVSVHPSFDSRKGSLVGLSLASPTHSLYIDCSQTSEGALLHPALQLLLLAPSNSSSPSLPRLPSPPSVPSWPLLLPSASSLRLLRRALMRPSASQVSLNPQLRFLTPRIDRLCALAPSRAPTRFLSAVEPLLHVASPSSVSSPEQRLRVSSYHLSLLLRYAVAYRVSDSLGSEVERGMRGWGDFRCSYAPLLLSERSHRWAVAGEQSGAPSTLPLLRLPSSHCVEVVEVGEDPSTALRSLMASAPSPALLGFDTEARPSTLPGVPNNPPSLVQLSTHSRSVLVRVDRKAGLPPSLLALLLDPSVTKVGQGSHADVQQLCQHYPQQLPPQLSASPASFGFLDLTSLSSRLRLDRPGLQGLVAGLMGHRLSKGQQMSNWATPRRLSGSQVEYAALDAFVSLQLKGRLEAVLERLTSVVTAWAEREGVEVQALSSQDLPVLPVLPTDAK